MTPREISSRPCFLPALCLCALCLAAQKPAPKPDHATGPIGPDTPPCAWGAAVKDELNGEWLWFGGTGGVSAEGALRTWIFRDGAWKPADLPPAPAVKAVTALAGDARRLYAAVANRFYRSESAQARSAGLDGRCRLLAAAADAISAHDEHARRAVAAARDALAALAPRLAGGINAAEVAAAREAWLALVRAEWACDSQPCPRAGAAIVYEAQTRKVVLFGGEGIHGAHADTWVYDCASRTWRNARPPGGPSPRIRSGIAARDGRVYLVGGQEPNGSMSYCGPLWRRLPMDVWQYDVAGNRWTLLRAGDEKPTPTYAQPPVKLTISPDGRRLSWSADVVSYGKTVGEISGGLDLPADDAGTGRLAVPPDTVKIRGLGFDPAWYEAAPPPDPDGFQASLKNLPPNRWINVNPPVRHVNRDWGTTVLDVDRDQLLHWAGGHSSHCGTDVAHYSLATNRWHILQTPELPFEYCYSNDGAPVPSLSGRPWGAHTYLSYAWDELSGKMIWTGIHSAYRVVNPCGVFTYDPEYYDWEIPSPQYTIRAGWFIPERHMTCMARTPRGVAVWADKYGGTGNRTGLWLADVRNRAFEPVAGTDPKDNRTFPPPAFGDRHGMTYDSRRDRVLMFHFGLKEKHRIWACDLKTGAVSVLEPKGSADFPAEASLAREATYLPDDDLVLICTSCKPAQKVIVYDCAADAWMEMTAAPSQVGKDGKHDPAYGVSTGIEWDARRRLLWLVQTDGAVYAMRFERASAGLR